MSNREAALAIARKMRDAYNARDGKGVGACYTKDATSWDVNFDGIARGRDAIAAAVDMYCSAFHESRFETLELFTDGKTICEQWMSYGVHRGELLGIAPTGVNIAVGGCNVMHIGSDGLIEREAIIWDAARMYRQLGVWPAAPEPEFLR
jgi:predicted ester cyclase